MTDDQVRVRLTLTYTTGDGRQGRRSSLVERIVTDDTAQRLGNWVAGEARALLEAARRETAQDALR